MSDKIYTLDEIRSIANPDGTFRMPAYSNLYPYLDEEVLKEELEKAYWK